LNKNKMLCPRRRKRSQFSPFGDKSIDEFKIDYL